MAIKVKTFTNTDLNASKEFEYFHELDTTDINITWWDQSGNKQATQSVQKIDENNLKIFCGGDITGTYTVIIEYADSIITTGRRLFEQDEDNDPDTAMRLGIGKQGTPTKNITLSGFLLWLQTNLSFALTDLSNIVNKPSARNTLEVYSKSESDTLLSQKTTQSYVDSAIQGVYNDITTADITLDFDATYWASVDIVRKVKWGNIIIISGSVTQVSTNYSGDEAKIFTLNESTPAKQVFPTSPVNAGAFESTVVTVYSNGTVNAITEKGNVEYAFNIVYMTY